MKTANKNNASRAHKIPKYIMIGGFLGAGKTTAVGKLAEWLAATGLRVGLITNDQGKNLVDTTLLRAQGFATEEIPGGCFCCRFKSLVDAAEKLRLEKKPDAFIAEPVGSCTDLVATVAYPLRKFHAAGFSVAPVSVMVDPVRAERVFGLGEGGGFSTDVNYIYMKQLQEADIIVIAKCDLLNSSRLDALHEAIAARFPRKEILAVSARAGTNLAQWFSRIAGEIQTAKTVMKVDYDIYAKGEALMGWLNCTVNLKAEHGFLANVFLTRLAAEIQNRLIKAKAEIAHLKMTVTTGDGVVVVAAANLVRNDSIPELSLELQNTVTEGLLTINLRAETAPQTLSAAMRDGLSATAALFPDLSATIDHLEHFRPGKPVPTYRLGQLAA